MLIDNKYQGVILKADGEVVNDWIVFRAQDMAVLPMLKFYREHCIKIGAKQFHTDNISRLIDRVEIYQDKYKSKLPTTFTKDLII